MNLPPDEDLLTRLHALGVPTSAAKLYMALLDQPDTDLDTGDGLAEQRDDDVRRLQELGLARPSPHGELGIELGRPDRALAALVHIRRRELLRAEESLAAMGPVIDALQGSFDRSRPRDHAADRVEVLETTEQAQVAITNILRAATSELCALHPGPTGTQRHTVPERDLALMARGVSIRSVYGPDYLQEDGALDVIGALVAAGEHARTGLIEVSRMLLVDAKTVVLPPTADRVPGKGAIIVRSQVVVRACQALFEAYWTDATPLSGRGGTADDSEDDAQQALIDLLAAGMHDEAVSRRLGVSVRTVRRRVRTLMDDLSCASRVQLGARLAQRGLLSDLSSAGER